MNKIGILYTPKAMWVKRVMCGRIVLTHSPLYITEDYMDDFGSLKLHGILNSEPFRKIRSNFQIRTVDLKPTVVLRS